MSQPFVGQIIAVGFNYAPVNWALCNGQTLNISEYTVLYQLLGTAYGGNGVSTFNLPNLNGCAAINQGQGPGLSTYVIGQAAGNESISLNINQIPQHTHSVMGTSAAATSATPSSSSLLGSTATGVDVYGTMSNPVALAPQSIGPSPGSALPHVNQQPFQVINYIIALFGIFPSQS
jgi:microcystin-dependent protein